MRERFEQVGAEADMKRLGAHTEAPFGARKKPVFVRIVTNILPSRRASLTRRANSASAFSLFWLL
jgi:hypothetical protein